ncbi:MAG: hypothetical protein KC502_09895 [Myxococcales bacterium]|nr:hypothetical protein [Myxococcales bacterium]
MDLTRVATVLVLGVMACACSTEPAAPSAKDVSVDSVGADGAEAALDAGANPADAGLDAGGADAGTSEDAASVADGGMSADSGGGNDATSQPTCPMGQICVSTFPFTHKGDTSKLPPSAIDTYSCKPSANESGSEQVYRVTLTEPGFLSVAVTDGAGVDVDAHILSAVDGKACISRGHHDANADLKAGTWYVVVDTFTDSKGSFSGAYSVDIGFMVPTKGPCGMKTGTMSRVKDGGNTLKMPATGPIVLEAHLVTAEEPPPYPATKTDKLKAHYALSQTKTGLVMYRKQNWAPLEGGSFYGAGIGSPKFLPVIDEGWYVNMYWTKADRPPRGTRMIVRLPGTSRAVVVSAGHETGPGNLKHIGGTPEETHFYLRTGHLSTMKLGIATDQTLPFGPRTCTD